MNGPVAEKPPRGFRWVYPDRNGIAALGLLAIFLLGRYFHYFSVMCIADILICILFAVTTPKYVRKRVSSLEIINGKFRDNLTEYEDPRSEYVTFPYMLAFVLLVVRSDEALRRQADFSNIHLILFIIAALSIAFSILYRVQKAMLN